MQLLVIVLAHVDPLGFVTEWRGCVIGPHPAQTPVEKMDVEENCLIVDSRQAEKCHNSLV